MKERKNLFAHNACIQQASGRCKREHATSGSQRFYGHFAVASMGQFRIDISITGFSAIFAGNMLMKNMKL